MADQEQRGFGGRGGRGGRGRGGDRERGGRGGRGRGGNRSGGRDGKDAGGWVPVTKLGRMVKERLIKSLEEIYLMSLPIKEYQIIDHFIEEGKLKDEVLKISPVQKQTRAGQRTRFKAFVVVGDSDGHIGLGVKCAKEVAIAIRGAIILAKLSVVPVRRGYWGAKIGEPHTVPMKLTGKCGSVTVRLVPAPRGTGIVAARVPKKLMQFAGVDDVYTQSVGHTATLGNFAKATFAALGKSYGYLTPDLWFDRPLPRDPLHVHAEWLAATAKVAEEKRLAAALAARDN
jgi:small subunit ribosomal protein S2e